MGKRVAGSASRTGWAPAAVGAGSESGWCARAGVPRFWPRILGIALALGVASAACAQEDLPPTPAETALLGELAAAIESLSDYRAAAVPLPRVRELPQRELEARFCDGLCSALAAYLPGDGIYLSAHLDPLREPEDRAALLHELVHHFQQGHPKFAGMPPCQREREKEREAVALQNAYLERLHIARRVRFNDAFDCAGTETGTDASDESGSRSRAD